MESSFFITVQTPLTDKMFDKDIFNLIGCASFSEPLGKINKISSKQLLNDLLQLYTSFNIEKFCFINLTDRLFC